MIVIPNYPISPATLAVTIDLLITERDRLITTFAYTGYRRSRKIILNLKCLRLGLSNTMERSEFVLHFPS